MADTTSLSAAEHRENLTPYVEAGIDRAEKLGNRGPVKFGNDGKLTTDILDAFWRTGFYVFEGFVDKDEIALLQADMQALLDRAPTDNGAVTDRRGRQEFCRAVYVLVEPLSDPLGWYRCPERSPSGADEPGSAGTQCA